MRTMKSTDPDMNNAGRYIPAWIIGYTNVIRQLREGVLIQWDSGFY